MIPPDLLKKIRRIHIRTARIVDEMLAGQYHSAFKGRGIEFEEVRPYQVGDDVRTIDWNVTARTGEPFVKLFREERELSVRLLVDLSASQNFGTHHQTKRELLAELCATLIFAIIKNNDKVGLTLFTDKIEKSIPPGKGSRHGLRLIREILFTKTLGQGTDLTAAFENLALTTKRRNVVFVVSDFKAADYEKAMAVAARRHDLIPVVISDRREMSVPNIGLIRFVDAETGKSMVFDTASRRNRQLYSAFAKNAATTRDAKFKKMQLDPIHIQTGEDFVEPLKKFFRHREKQIATGLS